MSSNMHYFADKTIKRLSYKYCSSGGRNNTGRMTIFTKGGGTHRRIRRISWRVNNFPLGVAYIYNIEQNPFLSAKMAQVVCPSGLLGYVLAENSMQIGAWVSFGLQKNAVNKDTTIVNFGNTVKLLYVPLGCIIFCVEFLPQHGSQLARAAGSFCVVLDKNLTKNLTLLKLPSGEKKFVSSDCFAVIGMASNKQHYEKKLKKAGDSRKHGRRPQVRGVAMNPIDHPHGGGEGKSSGGRPSVSAWGKLTKGGFKTRHKK